MPVLINDVATIRVIAPHRPGQKLVLRLQRPIGMAQGVSLMHALHFLQENEIRREPLQPGA